MEESYPPYGGSFKSDVFVLLYAQVDAIIYVIKALGFDDIDVKVGETGWSSKGDDNELGACLENAAIYNRNLLKRQMAKEGAPLKPNLYVYIFALFNENKKSGPTSEIFVSGFDRVIFIE
uniref:glucan endo-1,3-beta-glucosidase 14-like n=1 Tax=Fragaria vesca subsp. vesca TaxID=101020 RepID=UPI0005CA742F|nr:PREDICTED: glucan endo-1,3-beta-glucosidase 14-like [Fragaria vesca subsp. vesca]